jgi:hypothetical protein
MILHPFAILIWIEQGFLVKAVMIFAGYSLAQMSREHYEHLLPTPDHQRVVPLAE